MDKFFKSIEDFLAALKVKAVDAEKKGSRALRDIADWLDTQTGGKVQAAPDQTRLAACQAEIATLTPKMGVSVGTGGVLAQILAFIKSILDSLKP